MRVYKFGGASVRNAAGVRNLANAINTLGSDGLLVVVSAMGKMTNAFEDLVQSYRSGGPWQEKLSEIKLYHLEIIKDLEFEDHQSQVALLDAQLEAVSKALLDHKDENYNMVYDQVVGQAELISTRICSAHLAERSIENTWLDARECVATDAQFRQARVDWERTTEQIRDLVDRRSCTLTQGFIGRAPQGLSTTLGREGSDYTAAIFAHALDAEEVCVFKDVPGVLNADPRVFDHTTLLERISHKEAIEMAFYGASVIHPKTIQPLQRKEIGLKVRSFTAPYPVGTRIEKGIDLEPLIPTFIVKKNQYLLSISDKEFHFVMEQDLSDIFARLHRFRMKVNMIQNSAISFSLCIEDNFNNFNALLEELLPTYKVLYNEGVSLYTIRHFDQQALDQIEGKGTVLLKQMSRETAQLAILES